MSRIRILFDYIFSLVRFFFSLLHIVFVKQGVVRVCGVQIFARNIFVLLEIVIIVRVPLAPQIARNDC